ncbi:early nodulin-93-like [Abrus precatorius]|uniref:Early nodulin-93-like n=1 Tax=Abrus precatorius TaxID=3816 RepID=A0A8B8JNP2_ABRPR|nr:early nodulin-93-like [Abrus precatorius]
MSKGNVGTSSPLENPTFASLDKKLAFAKRCSREGVLAGAKAAAVASIATAIPTLASVRMVPWARANLNHTAQALIISTVTVAAYFIVADKTVLASARKNSFKQKQPSNSEA